MEPPESPSNGPVYAALSIGAASVFLCLVGWLGDAIIYLVIIAAGIAGLGLVHYWLWGRGLSERNDDV